MLRLCYGRAVVLSRPTVPVPSRRPGRVVAPSPRRRWPPSCCRAVRVESRRRAVAAPSLRRSDIEPVWYRRIFDIEAWNIDIDAVGRRRSIDIEGQNFDIVISRHRRDCRQQLQQHTADSSCSSRQQTADSGQQQQTADSRQQTAGSYSRQQASTLQVENPKRKNRFIQAESKKNSIYIVRTRLYVYIYTSEGPPKTTMLHATPGPERTEQWLHL